MIPGDGKFHIPSGSTAWMIIKLPDGRFAKIGPISGGFENISFRVEQLRFAETIAETDKIKRCLSNGS
jgi:hypothetical protein